MGELFALVLATATVALLICIPSYLAILGMRRYEQHAGAVLSSLIDNYRRDTGMIDDVPRPSVVFHTYHGVLLWTTQIEHKVPLSQDPRETSGFLAQLLKFNLTWGGFAYGFGIIPVLSYLEYRRRLKELELTPSRA